MKFGRNGSHDLKGFLDQGTSLTGELSLSGALRIDGNLHGSIAAADLLVIGQSASIHADIQAAEVQIHGAVYGNVECSRRLEICSTGQLRGDVRAPEFVIEAGGVFEGRSHGVSESDSETDTPEELRSPSRSGAGPEKSRPS